MYVLKFDWFDWLMIIDYFVEEEEWTQREQRIIQGGEKTNQWV